MQTITSSGGIAFNNVGITNTTANVTLGTSTDCSIGGNLSIDAGAVFDLAANRLTAVSGTIANSGTIKTQNTSATPVPANKTWGGTFEFTGNAAQTVVTGTYNNLTTSGSGGVSADVKITVNGILSLAAMNPSATKGILDMGSHTLLMGPASTTIGSGDVTGIVTRTTIAAGNIYTLGNEFTTFSCPVVEGQDLPDSVSLKINIGTVPSWKPGAISRTYDFIQSGGGGTKAVLNAHYLDSELNGIDENFLVDWSYKTTVPTMLLEHGRSNFNTTENWVAIANANIAFFASTFGVIELTLDSSQLVSLTWNGSVSTSWTTAENWTPSGAPSDNTFLIIPDASATLNDPIVPSFALCGTMTIQSGGILNTDANAQLTVNGSSGAWSNQGGTFNAGSSNVVFTNANATMNGETWFNNVTINTGTVLALGSSTVMGIAGTMNNLGTWRTVFAGHTTVNYNGGAQTIAVPNATTKRYSTLILSGSGIKTMPAGNLRIEGDFSISGTATATAAGAINTFGDMTIGAGASFIPGAFSDTIGGNFSNSGTFTGTGSTFKFNGTSAQTITSTNPLTFNNLTSDNAEGVTLDCDLVTTVSGTLAINSGKKFELAAGKQLTVTGTITNNGGNGGLVIHSDATGTGSLIAANLAAATAERYIPNNLTWHFLSSPVAGQPVWPEFAPQPTANSFGVAPWNWDFYYWNPNADTTSQLYWVNLRQDNTGSYNSWPVDHPGSEAGFGEAIPKFTVGRGYLAAYGADYAGSTTHNFAGNLNYGNQSIAITNGSNPWNLVGNPFPSAVDWRASGWGRSNLAENGGGGYDYWIFNGTSGNYGVFN
ncbi:MAG: hypothetical protein NTW16_11780, partial [Bacteroidetes bacterium]|nr:hypothetical protein [Bacteroidota bacterium]